MAGHSSHSLDPLADPVDVKLPPPDSRLRERRDNRARFVYAPAMSTAEIINELPKLPEADRRAIREVLLGIANEDPDVGSLQSDGHGGCDDARPNGERRCPR